MIRSCSLLLFIEWPPSLFPLVGDGIAWAAEATIFTGRISGGPATLLKLGRQQMSLFRQDNSYQTIV